MTPRQREELRRRHNLRTCSGEDIARDRGCERCNNWLGVPRRGIGLCPELKHATGPGDMCDLFEPLCAESLALLRRAGHAR